MIGPEKKMKPWIKKILITALLLLIGGGIAVWLIFTEKFSDTSNRKAAFTVNAIDLIREFEKTDSIANNKYREQIITVNGRITEIESAAKDTSVNIRMTDSTTSSYIIFTFQQQHLQETKELKVGDSVSVKGSCSGGTYSDILEAEKIEFKRCAINKN
jgi:RecG-like helicase